MYKVIVQVETLMDGEAHTFMKTVHDVTTESKRVIAATLRSLADEFDPSITKDEILTIFRGQE